MKVLYLIPAEMGGAQGRSVHEYANRLERRGVQSMVLCNGDTNMDGRAPRRDYEVARLEWEGALLSKALKKRINTFDPDIVHVWGNCAIVLAPAMECAIGCAARLIIHLEDDYGYAWSQRGALLFNDAPWRGVSNELRNRDNLLAWLSRINLENYFNPSFKPARYDLDPLLYLCAARYASGFTAIWHPLAEQIKADFDKPVALLPPGYAMKEYLLAPAARQKLRLMVSRHFGLPENAVLFAYSGSLRHLDEELETLLSAFSQVAEKDNRACLFLWGKDWQPQRTDILIRSKGLQNAVFRLGNMPEARSVQLLSVMDVLLCVGFNNRFNHDRLPTRLCQFFGLGKPVIMHRAGFGESLEDGVEALLTNTDRSDEWAAKMMELLDNPALRERLCAGALAVAARCFNTEHYADNLTAFYRKILDLWHAGIRDAEKNVTEQACLNLSARLKAAGIARIALYGAGKHTRQLIQSRWLDEFKIVCIWDDAPSVAEIGGIPVYPASDFTTKKVDFEATVLSSDAFESALHHKATLAQMPNIFRLYGG